ncbi:pyridoxamine 5'-phosphate oxidase family protein [Antarcticibacterium sp. 1MA-6-2]|uniref:pyridoxamine 5'-phosphate oxidase family protein n=1 Tax=Antarcticibacterium sp. 1MA-6-2 TaxID=2908210 RepID=UPI001F1CFAC1|nr:pyridoxamine 5'-phosphate oxidase family protein [Antarcticibacterium sp. 1MA-6-2]UJH92838.1 pyridoxamine 5'-phosphate oxidase family protein [Antarcticibacterium sp. 1MA-6-2]
MSTENLASRDALKKMTDLVDDIKFAMLLTALDTQPISAIPMTTKKVDEAGNIWFLSGLNSEHNANIVRSSNVQLLYSDPSDMEFISIYGEASVVTDKSILEELYNKKDDAWFTGVDDPNLTALKITPKEAYYWDTKENKYISLFKMGISAITGDNKDVGEKGKLKF